MNRVSNLGVDLKRLIIAAAMMTLIGCSHVPMNPAVENNGMKTLTGTVMYREKMLLPPGARLQITLEDVSKMDVASETVAISMQPLTGTPPYNFTLSYAQEKIVPKMRYGLRAKILLDEKLLFTSTQYLNPFNNPEEAIVIPLSIVN